MQLQISRTAECSILTITPFHIAEKRIANRTLMLHLTMDTSLHILLLRLQHRLMCLPCISLLTFFVTEWTVVFDSIVNANILRNAISASRLIPSMGATF
jgi:hypothetical protein